MRKVIDIFNERNEEDSVDEAIDKELSILYQALQEQDDPQIAWSKMRLETLRSQKFQKESC